LLVIVTAFKKWRVFSQSIIELFMVKTDYKNLIGFLMLKELNKKLVRWAEMLIEYHFKIKYIKRLNNIKVKAFSRKIKL